MGEKKLNFNAPLMSVRRYATFSSSSSKGISSKIVESSPSYRRHNLPPFEPEFNLDQVTEPVAVPFHWEHIPGRPKDDSEPKAPQHNASISPRAPPGKVFDVVKQPLEKDSSCQIGSKRQVKAYSFNDNNVMESKYSKEGKNERWRQELEDEDAVYSDAIDTLLSVESVSLKCSENGMSGCDGADLKPSGAFLRDPQTRDFMMRRFLPAAKAMTLDSPHYASKKQLVVIEQPREVKHLRSEANRTKENERRPSMQVPYYNHHELEEENEDEVDEYDVSHNISIKGCGFLPRLCLRNSLCLLNPVPGMKHKNQSHFSSTSKPSTSSKTVKKDACEVAYKQKSERGFRSGELPLIKSNWGTEASRFRYSGELQRVRSSSPFGQSRSAGVSPYRNRPPQSPFGTLKEENIKVNKKFNSSNIGSNKFQEVLAHQRAKQGSISTSPTIEKTLYVDTVKIAAVPSSKLASLYAKRESDSDFDEFENLLEPKGQKEASPAECFSQYIKRLNTVEEPKVLCSADDKQILICEKSHLKGQPVIMDASGQGLGQKMKNLDNSNVNTSRAIVLKDQLLKEQSGDFAQSPLPPPLPKSPSESWLWRTLPSIPLRNLSALTSNLGSTKRLECNTSSTSSKWETIVKTSYLHNDHTRYSEELIAHNSRQSKA